MKKDKNIVGINKSISQNKVIYFIKIWFNWLKLEY